MLSSALTVKFVLSFLCVKEKRMWRKRWKKAILLNHDGIQCLFVKLKKISNIFIQVIKIMLVHLQFVFLTCSKNVIITHTKKDQGSLW